MRILITGGAGFLGSNLVGKLLHAGHDVVVVDNLSMGRIENLTEHLNDDAFAFVNADVTDAATFEQFEPSFDCIVHLAAFKIPRYGKALDTLQINYRGTENTLEFGRKNSCKCVLASTSDVYGRNPELPFSEEHTDSVIGSSKAPRWAYAVSKLFDEHLALAYQDAYGFPGYPAQVLRLVWAEATPDLVGWTAVGIHRRRAQGRRDSDSRRWFADSQLYLRVGYGRRHIRIDRQG